MADLSLFKLFSSVHPTTDLDLLQSKGVTHILQITDLILTQFQKHFTYKVLPLQDISGTMIIDYFAETNEFIQGAIDGGGKVLVHW